MSFAYRDTIIIVGQIWMVGGEGGIHLNNVNVALNFGLNIMFVCTGNIWQMFISVNETLCLKVYKNQLS